MKIVTTCRTCCAVFALVVTSLPALQAQEPKTPARPAAQSASTTPVTLTATVEAIDQTNRIVTLKGPAGNLVDVYVDESHKRFNELKVGDQVKAEYYESLALLLRKPGETAPTTGVKEAVTPRAGGLGQTVSRQLTMSVTVVSLDPAVPSITVKGPKGNVVSMRVEDAKRLEGVKAGDSIDVTYTQAMLVTVSPLK